MATTFQSWRDRAIERSRVLTDGFEVALTWAGAVADWILFLCLVSNIVEVLAKLGGTPFSNIVMGTQSILLDIGGFALLTMAVHAHQRGERRIRNSAAFVGAFLMLVTLATVVLLTVGNLWPKAADQVQGINQGLILARIGMTIVYEATIHLLRHADQQEQHMQQAQVQQANQFSELRAQFSRELSSAIEQVRREFSSQVTELSQMFSSQLSNMAQEFRVQFSEIVQVQDESRESLAAHQQALTALAALPNTLERHERTTRQALAEMRASIETGAAGKPKLSVVNGEKLSGQGGELSSRQFIEDYLTKHPEAKNSEVIAEATKFGLTFTQSYVSQIRKALHERSA